jgi:hypothetical protein
VQYLPEATQGVIVQPLGSAGVLVVGTDTLRGLSRLDQVRLDLKGVGWGEREGGCEEGRLAQGGWEEGGGGKRERGGRKWEGCW